ncbi:MAG: endonuclease domain-containing protein [Anaerolineaceae bacterium]
MPPIQTKNQTRANARQLRRDQTLAETKLWLALRSHQLENIHFRRQHPIGNYIVDFCAPQAKLIIELDGSQHLEQQEYDAERTEFLESKGYRVLRFWNRDVLNNLDGTIIVILDALGAK